MTPTSRYSRLEIAVGERPMLHGEDVIYLDARPLTIAPFVQADMTLPLPFDDEQFTQVTACHCVEHISHRDVDRVLAQWVAKLAHNGLMHIEVPNLSDQARRILENPLDADAVVAVYGEQTMPDDMNLHRGGFTAPLLSVALQRSGLSFVRVATVGAALVGEGRRIIPDRHLTIARREDR